MTRLSEIAFAFLWTWFMYLYFGLAHLVAAVFEPTALGVIIMILLYLWL